MHGICDTWVSSYWQCFILHVEVGGVVVRFRFTLMILFLRSRVLTIFIVVMRLCDEQGRDTRRLCENSVHNVICDSYGTLRVFFFNLLCSFSFESWNWSQVHKECMKLLNLKHWVSNAWTLLDDEAPGSYKLSEVNRSFAVLGQFQTLCHLHNRFSVK